MIANFSFSKTRQKLVHFRHFYWTSLIQWTKIIMDELHWFNWQRLLRMNFIESMHKDNYGWTSLIQCTKIIMDELHWFNGQRFNLCRQSLLLEKFKLIIFWNMWVSYVKLQGSIWKDNLRWADDWGKRQTHFATETDDMEVGLEPDSTLCCCFSFKATTTYVVVHFSKSITGI